MQLSRLLFRIALLCAPVALFGTTWLYLYPIFHGCAFPTPPAALAQAVAPFRLLALGDPQLEGDSSLPDPNALIFPSLDYIFEQVRDATSSTERRSLVTQAAKGAVRDAGRWLEGKRKAIDLWGNDWYLAHIVRSQCWWTQPTHISVLGDLLGSQWITDGEFEKRTGRYWDIVMRGLEKVPESVFGVVEEDEEEAAVANGETVQSMVEVPTEAMLEGVTGAELEESVETLPETSPEAVPESVESTPEPIKAEPETIETVPESLEVTTDESTETVQAVNQERADNGNAEVEELHGGIADGEGNVINGINDEDVHLGDSGENTNEGADGDETQHEEIHDHEKLHEGPGIRLRKPMWGGTSEVLGVDKKWEKRVINIVGNHDIGYAGDLDESRVERFEKAFGDVNWDIWFTLPEDLRTVNNTRQSVQLSDPPALRLVVLNSMNLDTPAWSSELQTETYSFMNHIITTSRSVTDKTHATILLTHIPLEKESGVCVDSPYFDFWEGGHGVKEQNMLSDHSTKILLEGIFGLNGNKYAEGGGMGRNGIVVNGHDHAGCDVTHWIKQLGVEHACNATIIQKDQAYWPAPQPSNANEVDFTKPRQSRNDPNHTNPFVEATSTPDEEREPEVEVPEHDPMPKWKARRFPPLLYDVNKDNECTVIKDSPNIREITLRSMMGEFSGYAGFLSAWFDPSLGEKGEWVFEFNTCGLGIQHWWWSVHTVDFILVVMLVGAGVARVLEETGLIGKEKLEPAVGVIDSTQKWGKGTNGTIRETKRRA